MHDKFLIYFDEVARQGSIRKAAARLNVSSSSVNRKILGIEDRLGIRLFDRRADGVELTSAGAIVLEHCRKTLFDYDRILHLVADIRDMRTGQIDIATLDSVALSVLPEVLGRFSIDYPGISYAVQTAEPGEIMQSVAEGRADVGVSFCNELHPDVRVFAEKATPIGAVMAPGHPLAERDSLDFGDLVPFALIRSYDAMTHRSFIDEALAKFDRPLSTMVYSNSLPLAKRMIIGGQGIGIYSKIGFIDEIAGGYLRYVPLAAAAVKDLRIGVLISARVGLLPARQLFARSLARTLRGLRLDS